MRSIKHTELKQQYNVNKLNHTLSLSFLQGEACNRIRKDLRIDCGSANITQDECVKSACCYDETDNGTCFDPKSKFVNSIVLNLI